MVISRWVIIDGTLTQNNYVVHNWNPWELRKKITGNENISSYFFFLSIISISSIHFRSLDNKFQQNHAIVEL